MPVSTFITDNGLEVPAVNVDQMREIDRVAIEETGPNLFQMMENAGRTLAASVMEAMSAGSGRTVVVLAGTGGNGGGGICAARHLTNHGVQVTLVVTDIDRLGPVPRCQLTTFAATDGTLASADALDHIEPDVIVDALIGYSLRGAPKGLTSRLIDWVGATPSPVISLDVPSGIHAGTGEAPGSHVVAAGTVTLALPKTGLDATAVGRLTLADIGIPAAVYRRAGVANPEGMFGHRYEIALHPTRPSTTVNPV